MNQTHTSTEGDRFDTILIGSSISTVLCAALLAKRGVRVLLVENRHAGDEDQLPWSLPETVFTGLEHPYVVGETLKELDLEDRVELEPQDELVQVISPQFRLLLHRNREVTSADLNREFHGAELEGLNRYFEMLYDVRDGAPGFSSDVLGESQVQGGTRAQWRRYFAKVLPQLAQKQSSESFRNSSLGALRSIELLSSPAVGFASYAVPRNLSVEQCLRTLALLMQGQWVVRAKSGNLHGLLVGIIRANGGVVKEGALVKSLVVEENEVRGVLLSSFEGVVFGKNIVVGADHKRLYDGLPDGLRDRNLQYDLSRIEPSHWKYSLTVHVNKDALPVGMAQNVAFVDNPDLPYEEENFLTVRLDQGRSSETVSLLVTALVPLKQSCLDGVYLRKLAGRMLRKIESFVPFVEFNIVSMTPDFRKSSTAISESLPFRDVTQVPEGLLQYYVRGGKEVQSFSAISWATPHPNVYFCGRVLWPSLGTYGEVLAARKVFEDIMRYRRQS